MELVMKLNFTTNGSTPADTAISTIATATADTAIALLPFDQGEFKVKIDLAWQKVENGLQQEAEGTNLWIEGTLDHINILNDLRQCYPADQEFGKRLNDVGYGEDRVSRHNRAALLNMAEYPDLTREVLEQTHSRSYQLVWRDEIQPRLPSVRQPADGESPEEAPTNNPEQSVGDEKPEETKPKKTRRPRKGNGTRNPPKEEWGKDVDSFFSDALLIANAQMRMKKIICDCTREKRAELAEKVTPPWSDKIDQGADAAAWLRDWAYDGLHEQTDKLLQEGRVVTTFGDASAPA
jgi:hypothetical protein